MKRRRIGRVPPGETTDRLARRHRAVLIALSSLALLFYLVTLARL